MRRREVITLLVGAAAMWPRGARAQQAKMPTIGFLGAGSGSDSVWKDWTAAFVQRLRELGWVEGRTVVIEYRWGEGRAERYTDIADEFVRLKVDVIVTSAKKQKRLASAGVPWRLAYVSVSAYAGADRRPDLARQDPRRKRVCRIRSRSACRATRCAPRA